MQYRVYDRQTLEYIDGGYVRKFEIDDDYIVNNNSTISVVKKVDDTLKKVTTGCIIVLIKDSGAYHKGVITAVDDTALTISYKSDKELFNDNIVNPLRSEFVDNEDFTKAFGIEIVVEILKAYFVNSGDKLKDLPITFITDGDVLDDNGNPKMLWTWSNDSINISDWLTELFEKYNLSLSWSIDFNTIAGRPDKRKARYIVTLSAITNSGGIIKDNVDMQTITYTIKEIPDATVCYVIDGSTKELLYVSSGVNLLNPASVKKNYIIVRNGTNWQEGNNQETNLTAYISVDITNKYTFSENQTDNKDRLIIAFDRKKKKLGYWTYNTKEFTFSLNSMQYVPRKEGENLTAEQRAKEIKYIRINYYNGATEVQLEKGDVKTAFDAYNHKAIYYLYDKDGVYSISTKNNLILNDGRERVLPVKTVVATLNQSSEGTNDTTPESVAKDKLIPSQFNQAIEIRINANSKMFDFQNAKFGDLYKIINEHGTIDSNYTGRKFSDKDKMVTLCFGLGRQNYTDLIQKRLRKQKYKETYGLD